VSADKQNKLIRNLEKLRVDQNELIDALVAKREVLDHDAIFYKDSVNAINARLMQSGYSTGVYEKIRRFADTVSDSYVSLLAANFLPNDDYADFLKKLNGRYLKKIPRSPYALQFNAAITHHALELASGSKAPAFSLPDANGRMISNADFPGRYVLIDFWASWCHPCREENKNAIKEVFRKYKDKGLTVISISRDTNRDNWLGAIKADGIGMWTHLSDLKGPQSPVATDYQVTSLPFNYLVDPNGMIVAKNLRGHQLETFVAGLFR
jgi:peroxiredoxin